MLEQADWEDRSFGVQWDCYVANIRNYLWLGGGRLCKKSQAGQVYPTAEPSSEEQGADVGKFAVFSNNIFPKNKGKWQAEDKECWQSERWWFL